MFRGILAAALLAGFWAPVGAQADDHVVNLTADMPSVTVQTRSGPVEIARNADPDAVITGECARTSRACPPFCIQPMSPAEGVATIGELELIAMLQDPEAVVIDSRVAEWFARGTIWAGWDPARRSASRSRPATTRHRDGDGR